jgi:hypothetical protein
MTFFWSFFVDLLVILLVTANGTSQCHDQKGLSTSSHSLWDESRSELLGFQLQYLVFHFPNNRDSAQTSRLFSIKTATGRVSETSLAILKSNLVWGITEMKIHEKNYQILYLFYSFQCPKSFTIEKPREDSRNSCGIRHEASRKM